MQVVTPTPAVAARPRAFVRVSGPDAASHLDRMVSNAVAPLAVGASCDALLLTPKGRVVAPLRIVRRGEDDFLVLTEPELGAAVRDALVRARFAAKADIELEQHASYVLVGADTARSGALEVPNPDYGVAAVEVIGAAPPPDLAPLADAALERLRVLARTPAFGKEIDDRVLPAEAGLVERAVSFTKGCYPGQEPIARLHYRGHANRALRLLRIDGTGLPGHDAEIRQGDRAVGRVTSSVRDGDAVLALAYVRVEVPDDADLTVAGARARLVGPAR
jgi:folate-binding protein YgfZ